jgi:hypothetical protein
MFETKEKGNVFARNHLLQFNFNTENTINPNAKSPYLKSLYKK